MMLTGETEELGEKTCPSATLSTKNPTSSNPGLSGGMSATNRLSHGTVNNYLKQHCIVFNYENTVISQ
jgi:hypothetical protein